MRFGVLGPLLVEHDELRRPVPAPRQRILLAALLLRANTVVSADELARYVWDGRPPRGARGALHNHVMRLRQAVGGQIGARLRTQAPGYLIDVADDELDLLRFNLLRERARTAARRGDWELAAGLLREALRLWRDQPLVDVPSDLLRRDDADRLAELRIQAIEWRIEADLRSGNGEEVVPELRQLVRDHPVRERPRAQLMLALYRGGRQAEALAVFQDVRRELIETLGVEPGPHLQRTHQQILQATIACPPDPAATTGTTALGRGVEPAPVPAQLPADLTGFTGRTGHLRQLDALSSGTGPPTTAVVISTITGAGGVGKTSLAVHWAHQVRDRFPDGQLFVNLHGYASAPAVRPVDALAQFLRALGVGIDQVPLAVEEAAAMYRTLLAGKRVLVILDNAASADQVRPLLPGSPGCHVVVTSRDRLSGLVARDSARRLPLDVLTAGEAHALITWFLGDDRVRSEPEATADLARVCDFLPLALRIAAANLADHPDRSIADQVAELTYGDRLAALEVDGDDQTAVRATFDLSYAALAPDERRLFRRLGLSPVAEITLDVAASLAGTTTRKAKPLLERLAATHLIAPTAPGRHSVHDLLLLYAAERADQEEPAPQRHAATRRLYDHYLRATDRAAELLCPEYPRLPLPPIDAARTPAPHLHDHAQALAWLDAERGNLLAVVDHTAAHGPRSVAWLLADALHGYFWLRMYTVEWSGVTRAGLTAAEEAGDVPAQVVLRTHLGEVHRRTGDPQRAVTELTRALALSRRTGYLEGQATALDNLGVCYRALGRLREAAEHHALGLEIYRQTGQRNAQALALSYLAIVDFEMGQLEASASHHVQALELYRQIGSRSGEAITLSDLSEVNIALGRTADVRACLIRVLRMHRTTGNRSTKGDTLRVLAELHHAVGEHDRALTLARTAAGHARASGAGRHEADSLNTVAGVLHSLGDLPQAIAYREQALRVAETIGAPYPQAAAFIGLATAYTDLGRTGAALRYLEQALDLTRRIGYRLLEGCALTALADVHRALGEVDRVAELAEQALAIHRATGHRPGHARTVGVLARTFHDGDATAAPARGAMVRRRAR